MKKIIAMLLTLCLLLSLAAAEIAETLIVLDGENITVNGAAITGDSAASVYLARKVETHEDVPAELAGVENRVITITDGGSYRISGTASDVQIAVCAEDTDDVRLILDGVNLTCRTSAAIAIYSARDPRVAGEYGVTIELAEGSENLITGSHNAAMSEEEPEFDGAIGSQVSLGFEGTGKLTVDADNEGVEVAYGHMTINGGVFHIEAGDDPLNVSEDGVGTLTVNDGYLYSAVKNAPGGEGDGIDSNGWIVFNGGTAINLAHPTSQDGGIDSDMGSTINGGVIVGAGNMYDPIESTSGQLFMMLEFSEQTDDLLVVTDLFGNPVFAYDFPYDYMYIAFSTPALQEGETYNVYLGGEIEGEQQDGLYTSITSYKPGRQLMHGGGVAEQRNPMMGGMQGFDPMQGQQPGAAPEMPAGGQGMGGKQPGGMQDFAALAQAYASIDLNELLKEADLNELLAGKDLNSLLTGFSLTDLLTEEQLKAIFGENADLTLLERATDMGRGFGGMGGMAPRGMESSADVATTRFVLTRENNTFSNVSAVDGNAR
ncbi:MAG: carbohydrate-binding domain-containing protein [Clostridia bacterium]|nr:carbohydrate-binding domain-containing protein [Clostridia bacterium]